MVFREEIGSFYLRCSCGSAAGRWLPLHKLRASSRFPGRHWFPRLRIRSLSWQQTGFRKWSILRNWVMWKRNSLSAAPRTSTTGVRTATSPSRPQTLLTRREDSDQSSDRYRLYEVAAAPHMDIQYYRHMPSTEDQAKAGQPAFPGIWPFAYQCDRPIGGLLELPVFQYTLNAAFANLDQWVRKGTAPPRAERMTVKDGGTPQATITTDQYGNGMGGVRSP